MGGKDTNFQVVYRSEELKHWKPGGWVIFQRPRECGGGYWLGKTYADCFWFEFERPMSLHDAICYINLTESNAARSHLFDDDFQLTP